MAGDGLAGRPVAGGLTRRRFLRDGGLVLAASAVSPLLWRQPAIADTAAPGGLHLQYGTDAATEMTVSWITPATVRRPRVRLGLPHSGFGRTIEAETRTYINGLNGAETYSHHAHIRGLRPGTEYVYQALQDGSAPASGTFRTAPTGRVPLRFTSFGDLGTGDPAWSKSALNGVTAVHQVEQFNPEFHLLNGDLAYANNNPSAQPQAWDAFFSNLAFSARNRPWMPAPGNHEVEAGGGPLGYNSYRTRFAPA